MVGGLAGAVALGTVLVPFSGADDGRDWLRAVVFTATVGLVMLLRARTHARTVRRIALVVAGLVGLSASFATAVVSVPGQTYWTSVAAMGAGFGALGWFFGCATVSPVVRRAVDAMEYLALASVVPLACWVSDLYGFVRGASLS
jgi:hypothetical protein